jgi:polyribonucleotide nucleotidyltransferase
METLSNDHSSAMRQAHRRQEELERANSELVRTVVEKDREVRLPALLTAPCDPLMSPSSPPLAQILRIQQSNEHSSALESYEQEIAGYQKQVSPPLPPDSPDPQIL